MKLRATAHASTMVAITCLVVGCGSSPSEFEFEYDGVPGKIKGRYQERQPHQPRHPHRNLDHVILDYKGQPMWVYDTDGDGCPDWILFPNRGRDGLWLYIADCEVVIRDDGLGFGVGWSTGDGTADDGGDGMGLSAFDKLIQQALRRGFGDDSLPPVSSAEEYLALYELYDNDPSSDPVTMDFVWNINNFDYGDNWADVIVHLSSDEIVRINPITPYTGITNWDIYEVPAEMEGDPSYFRIRFKGDIPAALAVLVDMGINEIPLEVDEDGDGTVDSFRTVSVDEISRQIFLDGTPTPFSADPSPF